MDKSLRSNTDELTGTKAAIKMAMRSPAGVRMVWTIVEGEDAFEENILFYKSLIPHALKYNLKIRSMTAMPLSVIARSLRPYQ